MLHSTFLGNYHYKIRNVKYKLVYVIPSETNNVIKFDLFIVCLKYLLWLTLILFNCNLFWVPSSNTLEERYIFVENLCIFLCYLLLVCQVVAISNPIFQKQRMESIMISSTCEKN